MLYCSVTWRNYWLVLRKSYFSLECRNVLLAMQRYVLTCLLPVLVWSGERSERVEWGSRHSTWSRRQLLVSWRRRRQTKQPASDDVATLTRSHRFTLTDAHSCHIGRAIKHPVPYRVKPSSFVICDIWALWRSGLSVRVPGCQKLQMTA